MSKEQKQFLRKVKKIVAAVTPFIADLKMWTFEIYLTDGPDRLNEYSSYTAAAYSDPKWEYKHCKLYFDYETMKDSSPYGMVAVVVHELYHAAISEMREWHPNYEKINPEGAFWANRVKHEESVVTALTDATLALLRKCGMIEV